MLTGSGSLSPKLLACWINSRDTLVLAQRAHHLEIARTVREQRGGVCPRTTLVLSIFANCSIELQRLWRRG